MNSFSMKIKKALSNKNVVTAICFILIGVILIVGYNYRISQATKPVKVPYALVTISPQTKIKPEMIGTLTIAADAVNEDVIYTDVKEIRDKYVNLESTIYAGSFFYRNSIVEKDELPTSALLDVPEGHTLLTLDVDMKTSYYNSLVPGDSFDLYVKTIGYLPGEKNKNDEIIVGKLIDKIKILAVKSKDGLNVFGSDEVRVPAGIIFAVPEEQALLIQKADYFSELAKVQEIAEIKFTVVPRGQKYKTEDGQEITSTVTSEQLEEYINDKTKDIDVNEIKNNDQGNVNKEN